jgi:hypothetical protein
MSRRFVPVIIAVVLTVGSAATAAAATQRVEYGPAQGVQATATGTTVEIRFTGVAAAFGQAHKGQRVTIACAARPVPGLAFAGSTTGVDAAVDHVLDRLATARIAAGGASVRATLKGAPGDACDVTGGDDPVPAGENRARAALTPAGATWIDEQVLGTRMLDLAFAANPGAVYRPAADVVRLGGGTVVALDAPDAAPPAGKIGYWSSGRAVSFVATSAAGRHLVLQDLGGGMLRTDVFSALTDWTPPHGVPKPAQGDEGIDDDDDDSEDLGPQDGVTGHLADDTLVIRFSGGRAAKAYRTLAGRRAALICGAAPAPPLLGAALVEHVPRATFVRVPRRGGIVRARLSAGGHDVCEIVLGKRVVATVLPTKAGRHFFGGFFALLTLTPPAGLTAPDATRYPAPATLAAAHRGVVPMTTPGQALKPGALGVWTDGDRQAVLATVDADGYRYLFADEGGGRIRTNAFSLLLALWRVTLG